jgi:hypothetical protein
MWIQFVRLRIGTNGKIIKHGKEPFGYMKCREFKELKAY